ncbi:MAG: GGDEF domain-containing protein [Clostridiaceae bacterium]|nr:GGDEF domain-containing protein [Clostridiaceae bacterium]
MRERINNVNKITRALISLGINCLLLIIAYFVSMWLKAASPTIKLLSPYISYVFFAAGMFFGWWFNRSRVFFCSLTLMLCQLVLLHYMPQGLDRTEYYNMILSIVSVYIPLNILIFSIQKERGIASPWGRMRLVFIAAELLTGAWIIWYNDTDLLQLFNIQLFPLNIQFLSGFSHLSISLFFITLIYLFSRQAVTGKNHDASFMGITIFSFAALFTSKDASTSAVMFALSGLMLAAVVLRASHSMAYLDELTGLPSRRALKEEMLKLGSRYTIAMLDIDHFKKFNDTHGHDTGDDVLKLVAVCIKGVGGGGKAFRYGGEEFTIIFPGKEAEEAIPYLEELREYIANRGFIKRSKSRPKEKPAEIVTKKSSYKKLYLTVSIGAAEKNEKNKNAEEVIVAADKALYRAKSKGRNCVSK